MTQSNDDAMLSRRTLLKTAALLSGTLTLTGCEHVVSRVTEQLGETIPEHIAAPNSSTVDPIFHLLSRAAYGPWPGDLERVRKIGTNAWIEEQLHPETIDDNVSRLRSGRFESVHLDPGTAHEFKKPTLREELVRHALLQSVYSKRQLLQVMAEFWTDHLNIDINKGDCIYLKASDDRLVVRKNALGKFRDLIRASATSPAMLVYLDGNQNKRSKPDDVPNENYGRELLELHTLGVHGGYTQKDVYEAARCLTGWRLHDGWQRSKVYFDPQWHDDGAKTVLGKTIPAGGGEKDLDQLIDIACSHPSTAHHIATKLVQRFVSDAPPSSLVKRVSETFTRTDGDIKSMMRMILMSKEFAESGEKKIKRPFQYIVSCLRSLGADTYAHQELVEYLVRMGQGPFQYPTPDGYPDEGQPWLGTLLWRWNFALALATNKVPSVNVSVDRLLTALGAPAPTVERHSDLEAPPHLGALASLPAPLSAANQAERLLPHFIGRTGTSQELAVLMNYAKRSQHKETQIAELIGLILSSPAFQRC